MLKVSRVKSEIIGRFKKITVIMVFGFIPTVPEPDAYPLQLCSCLVA